MNATTKAVNYTEAQEKMLLDAFANGQPEKAALESLAVSMGKTLRSVIAKTSRMGVYKSPAKAEPGKRVQKKEAWADAIAKIVIMSEADATSLTKANSSALQAIFTVLVNSKPF